MSVRCVHNLLDTEPCPDCEGIGGATHASVIDPTAPVTYSNTVGGLGNGPVYFAGYRSGLLRAAQLARSYDDLYRTLAGEAQEDEPSVPDEDDADAFRSGWDAARASMGADVAETLREAAVGEWAGRKA